MQLTATGEPVSRVMSCMGSARTLRDMTWEEFRVDRKIKKRTVWKRKIIKTSEFYYRAAI